MRSLEDIVRGNPGTPRLVVKMEEPRGDGAEQFSWGIVGTHNKGIPILSMIGHISEVQFDLVSAIPIDECGPMMLVIVWDADERQLRHFSNPLIPRDPLVGMLSIIKSLLVDSRMAQHAGNQMHILGPDGQPMR